MLKRLSLFRRKSAYEPAPEPTVLLWMQPLTAYAVLLALVRRRRILLRTLAAFLALAALWLATRGINYESTFTIVPPVHMANRHMDRSFNELWGSLASDQTGEGFTDGGSDTYWMDVLTRPPLLDRVIASQGLMQRYHAKTLAQAERMLKSHISVSMDESRLIAVTVGDTTPKRAQAMAQAYLGAIQQEMDDLAVTDAQARLSVYEAATARQEQQLRSAEKALVQVQMRTGAISLGSEAGASLSQIAQLRAAITAGQIQLAELRSRYTDQSPQVQALEAQLAAKQRALDEAQAPQHAAAAGVLPAANASQAAREFTDATRNVAFNQALYDALGRQLNDARVEEATHAPLLQVTEKPELPDHPSASNWPAILLIAVFLGSIFGGSGALLRQVYLDYAATPLGGARVRRFWAELLHRSGHAQHNAG